MGLSIYTDGSGLRGVGGWAYCITDGSTSANLIESGSGASLNTTSNRMEISAAMYGLKYILNTSYVEKHKEINVISDSEYLCNTVYFGWAENWEREGWKNAHGLERPNTDLWKSILSILRGAKQQGIAVNFVWTRGHAGNYFNEYCDTKAKRARYLFQDIIRGGPYIPTKKHGKPNNKYFKGIKKLCKNGKKRVRF